METITKETQHNHPYMTRRGKRSKNRNRNRKKNKEQSIEYCNHKLKVIIDPSRNTKLHSDMLKNIEVITNDDYIPTNSKGILDTPTKEESIKKNFNYYIDSIGIGDLNNRYSYKRSMYNTSTSLPTYPVYPTHSMTLYNTNVAEFIPVDINSIIAPYIKNISVKYGTYINPVNNIFLNQFSNTIYSLEDVKYTYMNIILKMRNMESYKSYKTRVFNSIVFSSMIDTMLSTISTLTQKLYNSNVMMTIIGGIATKLYNIEHYTNDLDVCLYPSNPETYYSSWDIKLYHDLITQVFNTHCDERQIYENLLNYVFMLNDIPELYNNELIQEFKAMLYSMNEYNEIPSLDVTYIKTNKYLTKVALKFPCGFIAKLADISYFDIEDAQFQRLQNEVNDTKILKYYNIDTIKVYNRIGDMFIVQEYKHMLKEKEILLDDLENHKKKYNQESYWYLIYKFRNSVEKLKGKACRRIFI